MRILHTADWHLGKTLEGRSRLNEQAEFLEELNKIVKEEKIDAVVMAGDAFDTVNPPALAEQLFYESLSALSDRGKRPVVVIAGNHDNPDRLSAASPLTTEHGIHLIGYPKTEPVHIEVPSADELLAVAALAYPSEARLNEVLSDTFEEKLLRDHYDIKIRQAFEHMSRQCQKGAVKIAASHLYVAGGNQTDSERPIEVGGAYTVAAESLPADAAYVALGHLHRPQTIKRAKTLARYSGSPLAYSFSEAGYAKSVTVVEAGPAGKASWKEIFLSSGKPLVKWKAANGLSEVYSWLEEGRDTNAWIDLEIRVTDQLSLEEIHRLRKSHPGFIHIRPIFEEKNTAAEPIKIEHASIEDRFKKFYEKQTGGAVPDEEMVKLFLELASGADDEEEAR
ncbi:exonuclease subunit SbcD [Bacillus atrophaeus]|uniref:Nuclease SbcCD subunit D n=1 Tax=Bacillus atrophaeus (strain 1942) TaxID=720555 RepID=A0ABM5LUY1_BACA1|nr:exonuclease subunit SbcD [Bacillus atrophaeus]AMR63496.1 exonuclease sbcCD subunit D [Bacillus subtilis subsp. globigii]ADP31542.1 DNA repair exonuclease [Bacillus atrophaeus 1942]AIK49009.1 exonuclease SbcCD, D subunit [Bacillus atrophaeus subsp. globigii]EIM10185.1 DNA repair exonuclease [Bacillus atrophaeus C89]KFK84344.1 exonuclease SbcCD, D subunit [Bacillus atrophaeus]